jgi:hypothetical protein
VGRLTLAFLGLLVGALPTAAQTEDRATADRLCQQITIPDQLDLACVPQPVGDGVTVEPTAGDFASLSRMTLEPVERTEANRLAWSDPAEWLKQQLTLDTSGLAGAAEGLTQSPDSPFAGEGAVTALDSVVGFLNQLGQLPLAVCDDPAQRGEIWEMDCRIEIAGFGAYLAQRLVIDGEDRYAIGIRTMNPQRLRHFEAIANSFRPPT